jgi:L-alanine-DL-glutamate epimerase-like enolase superfamily enzyme
MTLRLDALDVRAHPDDRGLLLRARAGALLGEGEAVERAGFSAPAERLLGAARDLARALLGAEFSDLDGLRRLTAAPLVAAAPAPARFALETALLDLLSQRRGLPLGALLGAPASAQLARSALVAGPEHARMAQEAGYAVLKVKAHGPWPDDLGRLRLIRAAVPALALRLDANGGLPRPQAPALLRDLQALNPEYLEEPIPGRDPARWAELLTRSGLRADLQLAVDESALEDHDFNAHLRARVARVVILKPAFCGLFGALDRASRARAVGLEIVVTSALEGPVGCAAAAHLAFALGASRPAGITPRSGAAVPAWLDPARPLLHMPDQPGLAARS